MPDIEHRTKKILIVDDDEVLQSVVREMLKNDFETFFALSGEEALSLIYKKLNPDLILLDILLPNMDGWEIFGRLKKVCFLSDTPIIFISSLDEEEAERHAFSLGAKDFIKKPFKREDLIKKINAILP